MILKLIIVELKKKIGLDKDFGVFDREVVEERKRVESYLERKANSEEEARNYFKETGISEEDLRISCFYRGINKNILKRM